MVAPQTFWSPLVKGYQRASDSRANYWYHYTFMPNRLNNKVILWLLGYESDNTKILLQFMPELSCQLFLSVRFDLVRSLSFTIITLNCILGFPYLLLFGCPFIQTLVKVNVVMVKDGSKPMKNVKLMGEVCTVNLSLCLAALNTSHMNAGKFASVHLFWDSLVFLNAQSIHKRWRKSKLTKLIQR